MVVFPGGGFQLLAMDLEGTEICDWMTSKGITCVLLRYRVPKSNDGYDEDCHCRVKPKVLRSLEDAQRTIKLVRARAKELKIDPNKVGVIGFSAGGFLVVQTSNIFTSEYKPVDDADKLSSRPDFAIAMYWLETALNFCCGMMLPGNGSRMDPAPLGLARVVPVS